MGEACGTRGRLYKFLWENLNERDHLEDLCMISGFRGEVYENRALLGCYVITQQVVVIPTDVAGQAIGPFFKGRWIIHI